MKVFKWMGAAAVATLILMTSCLGGGDNTLTRRGFAVGGLSKTYKPIVYTNMGQLHSPSLTTTDGGCYVVNYDIDFNAPENENAMVNQYYVAAVTVLDEISKGRFNAYQTDTTKLMPNEIVLKNIGASPDYGVYVGGHLFLLNSVDMVKDQKNDYVVYWDRSVEPVKGENEFNVYSLFLRASKVVEGTGTTVATSTDIRAFNMSEIIKSVEKAEKGKGSKGFALKINYLTNINQKDSSDLKWNSIKIPFMVDNTQTPQK